MLPKLFVNVIDLERDVVVSASEHEISGHPDLEEDGLHITCFPGKDGKITEIVLSVEACLYVRDALNREEV